MINYFKSRIIILFPCNFNSFLVCATTCTSLLQRIPKHIIALRYPFAIRNNSLRRPQLPHLSRCPGDKSCNYNKSSLKKQNDDKMRKIIQNRHRQFCCAAHRDRSQIIRMDIFSSSHLKLLHNTRKLNW